MDDVDAFGAVVQDFERRLRSLNRAVQTIKHYRQAALLLRDFQLAHDRPDDVNAVTQADVEEFMIDQLAKHAPATAAIRYRSLQQFARYLVEEGIIAVSFMAGMSPPAQGELVVPHYQPDELRRLLAACDGKSFECRRDEALIRFFLSSGARLSEVQAMRVDDLDMSNECATVVGKGNRARVVAFGPTTSVALGRYLRLRRRHRDAASEWLWLGVKGQLTHSGIAQMLKRRGRTAGVAEVRPHRFRHTFAHVWMAKEGNETDLRALAGWRSPEMVARYARSAASERAREIHHRLGIGEDV